MIYEPAEDSFLIQEQLKKYVKNKKCLDMGTGSGILALTCIKNGAKSVLASDISQETVKNAKKQHIKAVKSDLFSNIKGKFDVIIFNPPYLPLDGREDNESALITSGGKKGDEVTLKFLEQSSKYLSKNGIILLLLSSLTPKNRIDKVIKQNKYFKTTIAEKKLFMEKLYVLLIQKKRKRLKAN